MKKFAVASTLVVPAFAMAQATAVGPFTGEFSETYDDKSSAGAGIPLAVFDGNGNAWAGPAGTLLISGGWSFRCVISPHAGSRFAGSASQPAEYFFDDGVGAFGGYFGSNADASGVDATIRFFDIDDNLIDEAVVTIDPDCAWAWNGWEFGTPVYRIQVDSGLFGGAFVDMDSMEMSFGGGSCYADFDGDGELTIFDFLGFQNAFDAGDLAADCDGDGVLNLFDFLCFQNAFDAGCE